MTRLLLAALLLALLAAAGLLAWSRAQRPTLAALPLPQPAPGLVEAAFAPKLPPAGGPLRVYHLGHSLVGRDMPAMLAQLAPPGHAFASQLGWGASLREHWEPDVPVKGLETENTHPQFRPARAAVASGDYDAVVLTEMVELKDAILYHDSPRYLHLWADLARAANPQTEVYLYETWHRLDDPAGWLDRLDRDLPGLWEGRLANADLVQSGAERPLRVIPAGQVLAAFVRVAEAGAAGTAGGIDGIAGREDLFARTADGAVDPIHLGDLGNYLVALTHYAVLYRRSPLGLPHELRRADGSPATAPSAAAARRMQEVVWAVVSAYPRSGVAP